MLDADQVFRQRSESAMPASAINWGAAYAGLAPGDLDAQPVEFRPLGSAAEGHMHDLAARFSNRDWIHETVFDKTVALPPRSTAQLVSMEPIIAIAASSGGLEPLKRIVAALPTPCRASVFVVMHTGAHPSQLPAVLGSVTSLPVTHAVDGAVVEAGYIYVAPPDWHMRLDGNHTRLTQDSKVHHTRPAADPLFISAAKSYGERVVGIVLSGGDGDGAAGLKVIKEHGGLAIVQDPEEAESPSMPVEALVVDHPDAALPVSAIARFVGSLCTRRDG